ncbi:transposase [Leptothoe kymatousa TAU-MAC 1615]|uniref:Transposase n=2 Tax=Leptothoe TaxID=2651725 RepID=A0ABS5Y8H5_9CYAN|nr:transposase [Leptothoe kymatousa TAU-MAC 1615]
MKMAQKDCIRFLEKVRWNQKPQCPYCSSLRASSIEQEKRYHCNDCFTSYSVTVNTIFHKTHVNLQKWLRAILIYQGATPSISVRKLGQELGVSKNTAANILKRLKEATPQEQKLLKAIMKHLRKLK